MKKSLSINGVEIARIENGRCLIAVEKDGYDYMKKVNSEEFKEYIQKFSWILTSCDSQLKKEYREFLQIIYGSIF